jgi:hypothetical protein
MVWRGAHEAVGGQVFERKRQPADLKMNLNTVCRERFSLSDRQHAHRDERAILAVFVLLSIGAARHITRCHVTRCHVTRHRGHIGHASNSHALCRRRCYQRRRNQPHDHKDRKQSTDESAKIHGSTSHRTRNLGRCGCITTLPANGNKVKSPQDHTVKRSDRDQIGPHDLGESVGVTAHGRASFMGASAEQPDIHRRAGRRNGTTPAWLKLP